MPTNKEIAKIFAEVGEYLAMDDVPFKPRAYEKAAETVGYLEEEVADIYKKNGLRGLEAIPGVGASIALKMEELIKTGRLKYYEALKKKMPVDLSGLSAVAGVGPKHVKRLYKKLGIKNVADLKRAAAAGKIKKLAGFGAKSEENILKGIDFTERSGGRFMLGYILPEVERLAERLRSVRGVARVDIAGSIRRRKETIGDADILVVAKNSAPVMDFFVNQRGVESVVAHGETKSSVRLMGGLEVDLRVVDERSYGAALLYFTGSKDHNVVLRELAIKKGWKLNEYGLFSARGGSTPAPGFGRAGASLGPPVGGASPLATAIAGRAGGKSGREEKILAGRTEEEVYKKLGLAYMPPELRENTGEIEAALRQAAGKSDGLPDVIPYGSLKGDLQVQSNWTDGTHSILEMAEVAISMGLEYIAITDHTKRLAMTGGLDVKKIQEQWKEIDSVNAELKKAHPRFRVLKGTECDILADGSLDLPDKTLSKLDVVGVSVHSLFNLSEEEQTRRIIKAISNPNADILFHPTGRLVERRAPYRVDMDRVIAAAKKTGTLMEIDAFPERSDLKDEYIRKCVAAGVGMTIDSDAHRKDHFAFLEYGIAQARRGWAEKSDIANTLPVDKFLKKLK